MISIVKQWTLLFLLATLPLISNAQLTSDVAPLHFENPAEETRFHRLTEELRCVQCQNQSLADSNAQIANDMRREVMTLIHDGKSDKEIKQFFVDRYGEFVLYKPQVSAHTWLLWFGPLLVVGIGALVVSLIVKRRTRTPVEIPADDEQEW